MKKAFITEQEQRHPIRRLHSWLKSLQSTVCFMQTGAHPDDETSRLLASLSLGQGAHVVYVNAVRGQGGQNALGPERGDALGYLRTEELITAMDLVRADLAWLAMSDDDPIRDFGFSKSAEQTFGHWGEEHSLRQMVKIVRLFKPDIMLPTFLDVPGQHGHHRAITQLTISAFSLAADTKQFPELNLESWQPNAVYLPAWGGGGGSYDDEVPPPNATHHVDTGDFDPVYGATLAQIGEWSRSCHATQGMGRQLVEDNWPVPLHQLNTASGTPFTSALTEAIPTTLGELAEFCDSTTGKQAAIRAHDLAAQTLEDFPKAAPLIANLCALQSELQTLAAEIAPLHRHRVRLKMTQTAMAMSDACQMQLAFTVSPELPVIDMPARATLSWHQADMAGVERVSAEWRDPAGAIKPAEFVAEVSDSKRQHLASETSFSGPSPMPLMTGWHGIAVPPATLHAELGFSVNGVRFTRPVMPDKPLTSQPELRAAINPAKQLVNVNNPQNLTVQLAVVNVLGDPISPAISGTIKLAASEEVKIQRGTANPGSLHQHGTFTFDVKLQAGLPQGRLQMQALAGTNALLSSQTLTYPHIRSQTRFQPCVCDLALVDTASLDGIKVGWIDGGVDHAWFWTEQLGASVTFLSDDALLSGNLDGFDVIVSGVFAGATRPINAAMDRLKGWMDAGGRYVSQYHRPQDNWVSGRSAPYDLTPGSPSIRWRVTDAKAPVTILAPDHPLLTGPNKITKADFAGWEKERGLYFASSWDDAYTPLLAMSDAPEAPLHGSLLHAAYGSGGHVHCALNLFYQMDVLVPGAFRLFANLLHSPPR